MHYTVRWPDATQTTCYSPSLVVREWLQPGQDYPLDDFMDRVRQATAIASERVRARYGFPCSRAAAQLAALEDRRRHYADTDRVQVLSFDPA
jgi:uncharacterized repeat protein (TIGR04042 family)